MRRLLPLLIAMCLQNFVLWYAIEKLFMTSIGFDTASIAIMASVYAGTMLVFETPSGILADRWSRKGVLVIAGAALAASSLIGGLSPSVVVYILAAVAWGIYYALYSGTFDSMVYDTLVEETGTGDDFEKYSGRLQAIAGISLVVSSFLGGVVGQVFSLQSVYFLTVPFALASIVALLLFKEPQLHRATEHVSVRQQVSATFAAISKKGIVLQITATLVLLMLLDQMVFEFSQLWLIALAAPVILYGPANALLLSSVVFSGFFASAFAKSRKLLYLALGFMAASVFVLTLFKNVAAVVVALFIVAFTAIVFQIVFNKQLHDRLSSNIRAGAVSALSSASKLIFIPIALLFGFVSQQSSVFTGSWIIIGVALLTAVFAVMVLAHIKRIRSPHDEFQAIDEARK